MTDSTDDLDTPSIKDTYCPRHHGLWPHECGCDNKKTKVNKSMKVIKKKLDMDLITSLLRGEGVVLCGKDNEPTVELILEKDEIPTDVDDAKDKIESLWEF